MKEREKEQYLSNFELGPHDGFSKQLLERQSENLMDMQRRVEEHERRQNMSEKKWTELLRENQLNFEQAQSYKQQLEKQRQTYSKLLAMTERRVL